MNAKPSLRPEANVAGWRRHLRLASGVNYRRHGDDCATLLLPSGGVELPHLAGPFREALARLPLPPSTVIQAALESGPAALDELRRLAEHDALEDVLVSDGGTETAVAIRPTLPFQTADAHRCKRLRSNSFLRTEGERWALMNPATRTRIAGDPVAMAQLLGKIAGGREGGAPSGLEQLLADHGFLSEAEGDDDRAWEFHDQLFHAVTSLGRGTDGGYGATYLGANRAAAPPPPWLRDLDHAPGEFVDTRTPTFAPTPPLADVLARRRSTRNFGETRLSLQDIDALFALALRTRRVARSEADHHAFHPYPSGGARDEIATLFAVREGDRSEATLYSYVNHEHRFFKFDDRRREAALTLSELTAAAEVQGVPPGAAIVFAADYQRMAWKYEAIAYATILRNVGAIYQTVSLAADALGLASCALGGGWGALEGEALSGVLRGRVIVGAMIVGYAADKPAQR